MSTELCDLFPAGVVAVESRAPGDVASLLPEELACLGRAVPSRAQEFAAGRQCARRALAQFGVADFPLLRAPGRQPLWPKGLTGSITHTTGWCAAVVGECTQVAALGIDSEVVGAIGSALWPTICNPQELAWLDSLPAAQRDAAVSLVFAAKEALYKCQYPVVGQWIDFHDLHIEADPWGEPRGRFAVHFTRHLAIAERVRPPLSGRYLLHEWYVSAGLALPAAGT